MKYAVCMLVHQKPELIQRIVNRLRNPNVEIYIHLDAKCDMECFSQIKGVHFINRRVEVRWGGRSMVQAMYNLTEHVIYHSQCDYLLFISGEDFPVVKPDKYDAIIDRNKSYVESQSFPIPQWYEGGYYRVAYFYPFRSSAGFLSKVAIKLQKVVGINRYLSRGFEIYGGSQWININRRAAEYILNSWDKYYSFFKFTHIPDEMIFQTILLNSPLKDTVTNSNLRYIRFAGEPHPVTIDASHYEQIFSADCLFCRKIHSEQGFDELELYVNSKLETKGIANEENPNYNN